MLERIRMSKRNVSVVIGMGITILLLSHCKSKGDSDAKSQAPATIRIEMGQTNGVDRLRLRIETQNRNLVMDESVSLASGRLSRELGPGVYLFKLDVYDRNSTKVLASDLCSASYARSNLQTVRAGETYRNRVVICNSTGNRVSYSASGVQNVDGIDQLNNSNYPYGSSQTSQYPNNYGTNPNPYNNNTDGGNNWLSNILESFGIPNYMSGNDQPGYGSNGVDPYNNYSGNGQPNNTPNIPVESVGSGSEYKSSATTFARWDGFPVGAVHVDGPNNR